MATKNITKKIAALSELRKDPAAAITNAWASVSAFAEDATLPRPQAWDVDVIDQIIGAVIADINADKKAEA